MYRVLIPFVEESDVVFSEEELNLIQVKASVTKRGAKAQGALAQDRQGVVAQDHEDAVAEDRESGLEQAPVEFLEKVEAGRRKG